MHILIPLDSSRLSGKAIKNGVALARSIGARVTGFTAMPEYPVPNENDLRSGNIVSIDRYEKGCARKAAAILARLSRRAEAAGVSCSTAYVFDNRPDQAIAKAAKQHRCDLIVMATHGRTGLSALVNGSQTRGVLAKTTIPTLVCR